MIDEWHEVQDCFIDVGYDWRPYIFKSEDNGYLYGTKYTTEWDGVGTIRVSRDVFNRWFVQPTVCDTFTLCGHNLIVIDDDWEYVYCKTETPETHFACIQRLAYYTNMCVWARMLQASRPRLDYNLSRIVGYEISAYESQGAM